MNTIKNLARRPLRVPLPRGKTLHLNPARTGQVTDEALEHPPFKKLVDAGEIEVLGHGEVASGSPADAGGPVHADTHGRGGASVQRRSGTRGS